MSKPGVIDNTMVEQSEEIFHGHRKWCLLKISEEKKNVIYMEKENITFHL